jgi:hypothetical protein
LQRVVVPQRKTPCEESDMTRKRPDHPCYGLAFDKRGEQYQMPEETLEDRFASVAEKKGYITALQVVKAQEIQVVENTENGEFRFIGEILLDQGFMTKLQMKHVLESLDDADEVPQVQEDQSKQAIASRPKEGCRVFSHQKQSA